MQKKSLNIGKGKDVIKIMAQLGKSYKVEDLSLLVNFIRNNQGRRVGGKFSECGKPLKKCDEDQGA